MKYFDFRIENDNLFWDLKAKSGQTKRKQGNDHGGITTFVNEAYFTA